MNEKSMLASDGGHPVRVVMLPYGRHLVEHEDIEAVVKTLQSDWLTTGPKVAQFESSFAKAVGAKYAVAVSSGTAALHSAVFAAGIEPGDEVIVTSMTFAASANCIVFQGGTPVFVDVDPENLLIDPASVEVKITQRTKAIIAVDYAGQACDYDSLRAIADRHSLVLIADACHALGGAYRGRSVGTLADLSAFSLHPVKHITTGEGGIITTDDPVLAERLYLFRNHGISSDHYKRQEIGSWFYEMVELGYNYRLTDFQCALGLSQLAKLRERVLRRQEIARLYDLAFTDSHCVKPLVVRPDVFHAYHLYVIRLNLEKLETDRSTIFRVLWAEGIGVNVHYIPVHLHPFYKRRFGTDSGLCPVAESAYNRIISLPIFSHMTDAEVDDVIKALRKVENAFIRQV